MTLYRGQLKRSQNDSLEGVVLGSNSFRIRDQTGNSGLKNYF